MSFRPLYKIRNWMPNIKYLNYEDLLNIDGIGETQVISIKNFFFLIITCQNYAKTKFII